jgi:CheY-like chemotaxis protein
MRRGKNPSRGTIASIVPSSWEDESLAALTHDLRNSLASIVSALHILRLQRYPNAVAEQAGKTLERQAEHLTLLADHLSELAGVPKPRQRSGVHEWQRSGSSTEEIPPRRILVVDDNRDAADSTGTLLLLWGHQVRVAYDGPSAVGIAREFQPEFCLLDLGMPGMDGYQVAEALRRAGLGALRLVAMTGFDGEADQQHSREAGFDAFLVKPVEVAALQAVLSEPHGRQDANLRTAGFNPGPVAAGPRE